MARPRRRRRRDAALALAALVLALPFCLDLGRRRPARASSAPTDAVAVWDRGVYTPRRRPPPEPRAPALVRAWRRGRVDYAGSPPGGREVYAFWVNQDVVVPRAAFLGAVRGAAASPLNRRLLAG